MSHPTPDPADRRGFLAGVLGGATAASAADGGPAVPNPRLYSFVGGPAGGWSVVSMRAVVGDGLPAVERVDVVTGVPPAADGVRWVLRGVTSNTRYTTAKEKGTLAKTQAALGRPAATRAALIPIRKSAEWWALSQDERRAVFEERSRHTTVGLKYLPAVARRLHHCRDLSESEPFDFLTFFDFAPADEPAFDGLLAAMRASEEWKFVDREVDIRLTRAG
jgi:hypothetical protein